MPKSHEIVSIDIGNESIKAIVVDYSEGYGNVVAFSNVKTRGIENGEIKDVVSLNESMLQIIEDLEEQIGKELKGDFLISSSCGDFTLSEVTEELLLNEKEEGYISEEHVSKLTENLFADISPANEKNSLHLFVKRYVLDDKKIVVNPIGMKARKLSAVYTTVMGSERYRNVVEYATKDIIGDAEYYISPISSAEAVLSNVEKDRGILHVDLGYNSTIVTMYHANTPLEMERIEISMKNVIKDIAIVLKTSLQEAERLLRTYGVAMYLDVEPLAIEYKGLDGRSIQRTDKEYLSRIIYARLREIFMKVKKLYKDYTLKYPEFSNVGIPGGIVLTGGGAALQRIEALASDVFRCPVRIGSLFDQEKFKCEVDESVVFSPLYTAAFGNIIVYEREQNLYAPITGEKSKQAGKGIFKKISDAFSKIFG
ncbi:cell division protein FtsA [Fervidobacterium sp. 2310opik-2]|uniref:cell division protein FtsA n=1 Tax=Fervidobacterium sp. 2310opik-2 TaxID=1755815 RepID=UPI0013E0D0E4|nr:cell division protein FtsA [Fervidobacterium sp. 2310opik-2]KAF2961272.1 cell division protein FtsA [Fervidobacterium sp. 2310opik-2]